MRPTKELLKTGFVMFPQIWDDGGMCALSIDTSGAHQIPSFIWCTSGGWDHVVASYSDRYFTPDEVELVKRFFFRPGETLKVAVEPADPSERRPYGIHLWLPQKRHVPRPKAEDHLPYALRKNTGSWKTGINPALHLAVQFQAMACGLSPDAYLAAYEADINRLFSGKQDLSVEEQKEMLSFYKKPSVERYFIWHILKEENRLSSIFEMSAGGRSHKTFAGRSAEVNIESGDGIQDCSTWKKFFHPLLYPSVRLQSHANHMSPEEFVRMLQNRLDASFADDTLDLDGDDQAIAEILRTEFGTKPDVQSMFLYMVLEPPVLPVNDAS